MKIEITVFALCAMLFAPCVSTEAQQQVKIPRIGFLFIGSKDQSHLDSFHQGLRDLGYVEGKNIAIEYRYAEGKPDALPALAAELIGLNVDVILTTTVRASRVVLQPTHTIPIIGVGLGDFVDAGLVKSLARPGGNLTGLSNSAGPGMRGKQLALLKETVPSISEWRCCGISMLASSQVWRLKKQRQRPRLLEYKSGLTRSRAQEISSAPSRM